MRSLLPKRRNRIKIDQANVIVGMYPLMREYHIRQGGQELTHTPYVERAGRDISKQSGYTDPMNGTTEDFYDAIKNILGERSQSVSIYPLCVCIELKPDLQGESSWLSDAEEAQLLALIASHLGWKQRAVAFYRAG